MNARYSNKSYAIFSVPAMKNGRLIRLGRANMKPTNSGLMAAPIVRATPAMPAAADRSEARGQAGRQQGRESCENVRSEKDGAERAGIDPEAQVEPVRRKALHDETAAERVQREERRQLENDVARSIQP
jgi:hypothetical protein